MGKTYYLEHGFKDFIEKKNSDNAKFSVALISLYGVSSPEDLLEFGISLELFAYWSYLELEYQLYAFFKSQLSTLIANTHIGFIYLVGM